MRDETQSAATAMQRTRRYPSDNRFQIEPHRWKMEWRLGWLNGFRVLSKDYDVSAETSAQWFDLVSIHLLQRRLARV